MAVTEAGRRFLRAADFSGLPDEALIDWVLKYGTRDDRAFAELFRRYQGMVWQICFRYTDTNPEAEDLVQETFFRAYRGLKTFERRSSFKTWLHRIAINTCLNHLRSTRAAREATHVPLEAVEETLEMDAPTGGLRRVEQREELRAALSQLKVEDQEVLLMKDVEELSYEEIAHVLQIGVSAAKMRVQRARIALKAQLDSPALSKANAS